MSRLRVLARYDSPVREASGLCVFTLGGREHLAVVGDRRPIVAWAPLEAGAPGEWTECDVAHVAGAPDNIGQFEGVADAGEGRLLVLGEEPAMLILVDPVAGRCLGWWSISVTDLPDFQELWDRDDNSRGEGVLPLADSRVLIVKEKDPVLAVELAPPGEPSSVAWKGVGEAWRIPAGNTLTVSHWAEVADAPGDLSDCEPVAGRVLAVSDQDRCLVELVREGESVSVGKRIALDKAIDKPEGLAVTASGDWFVAMDAPDRAGAIVEIEPFRY